MSNTRRMACDAIEAFNDKLLEAIGELAGRWPEKDEALNDLLTDSLVDAGRLASRMCDRQEELVPSSTVSS